MQPRSGGRRLLTRFLADRIKDTQVLRLIQT
jgi:hypothetical protein